MSDFVYRKGYIYPISKEKYEELDKKIFDLQKKGYDLEVFDGQKKLNHYLVLLTYDISGKTCGNFGNSRLCNQIEIYQQAPKFREILGDNIDTAKLKYIEYCWYNCAECFDYYEESNEKANGMLEQVIEKIEHYPMPLTRDIQNNIKLWLQELIDLRMQIERLKTELNARHQKAIDTANELAAYRDKTCISEDFLIRNGFEKRIITNGKSTLPLPTYLYCDEVEEISVKCIDAEMGAWYVSIGFLDCSDNCESLTICTIGQMRMFLAIEGLTEIANQLKS